MLLLMETNLHWLASEPSIYQRNSVDSFEEEIFIKQFQSHSKSQRNYNLDTKNLVAEWEEVLQFHTKCLINKTI